MNSRPWRSEMVLTGGRQPGTSHVTFTYPGVTPLTVPAHKTIKAVYIKRFLELIDRAGENDDK